MAIPTTSGATAKPYQKSRRKGANRGCEEKSPSVSTIADPDGTIGSSRISRLLRKTMCLIAVTDGLEPRGCVRAMDQHDP